MLLCAGLLLSQDLTYSEWWPGYSQTTLEAVAILQPPPNGSGYRRAPLWWTVSYFSWRCKLSLVCPSKGGDLMFPPFSWFINSFHCPSPCSFFQVGYGYHPGLHYYFDVIVTFLVAMMKHLTSITLREEGFILAYGSRRYSPSCSRSRGRPITLHHSEGSRVEL